LRGRWVSDPCFPSYEKEFLERPGAVQGAPEGAALRTLDGEDRSEQIEKEGKQIPDTRSISETRASEAIALLCVNHGSI
jgi:hypothetical protein